MRMHTGWAHVVMAAVGICRIIDSGLEEDARIHALGIIGDDCGVRPGVANATRLRVRARFDSIDGARTKNKHSTLNNLTWQWGLTYFERLDGVVTSRPRRLLESP